MPDPPPPPSTPGCLCGCTAHLSLPACTHTHPLLPLRGHCSLQANSTGSLLARLETDAALVQASTGPLMGLRAQNVVCVVGGLALSLATTWKLALVTLSAFPSFVVTGILVTKLATCAFRAASAELPSAWGLGVGAGLGVLRGVGGKELQDGLVTAKACAGRTPTYPWFHVPVEPPRPRLVPLYGSAGTSLQPLTRSSLP